MTIYFKLLYVILWPVLFILSFVYAFFVALIKILYKYNILKSYRPKAKVISVGNITVGGSGKTPLVEYLASRLAKDGHSVAVLLRGYKRPNHGLVAYGLGSKEYYILGDEGSMLKQNLAGKVKVLAGVNRSMLASQLDKEGIVDTIILDDGFQHWRLKRDLDIVVVDATNPFSNKFLLPAGCLREGVVSLKRADIFVLSRCNEISEDRLRKIELLLLKINPDVKVIKTQHEPQYIYNIASNVKLELKVLKNEQVCLLCAIANPKSFLNTIEKMGAKVLIKSFFHDHYNYSENEIMNLFLRCKKSEIKKIIVTEKDAQKLVGLVCKKNSIVSEMLNDIDVLVLKIALKITEGEEVLNERLNNLYSI